MAAPARSNARFSLTVAVIECVLSAVLVASGAYGGASLVFLAAALFGALFVAYRRRLAREHAAVMLPDYARIAVLERDIYGETFEHDGAPAREPRKASPSREQWRECRRELDAVCRSVEGSRRQLDLEAARTAELFSREIARIEAVQSACPRERKPPLYIPLPPDCSRVARRMIELSQGRIAIINPEGADLPGGGRSLEDVITCINPACSHWERPPF
jgi:hypothetical protein